MTEKPALSKSRLKMLQRCPMQYWHRYVEGIVAPPGVSMLEGTAVHSTIHENLIHKKERGELLPAEYISDLAAERVKTNWLAEEPMLDEDEAKLGKKIVRAQAIDRSVKMARIHHTRLAPLIRPLHIERRFRLRFPNFLFDLRGAIDIQEVNGRLRDSKTTRKTPKQVLADRSIDLDVYYLAACHLDEKPPPELSLDFMVGQSKVYEESFSTTRCAEDNVRTIRLFEKACKVVESGVFMPADPESWICSAKWCGYFDRCPFGRRREVKFGQAGIGESHGEKQTDVQS